MSQVTDPLNLTECDREPIHIPGTVQPHGVLLGLDPESLKIRLCSTNVEQWWQRPAESLINQPVATVLGELDAQRLTAVVDAQRTRFANPLRFEAKAQGQIVNGIAHWNHGLVVLELEPLTLNAEQADAIADQDLLSATDASVDPLFQLVFRPTMLASQIQSLPAFANAVCREVRQFTGYDRVMVYRFDDNGDGEVLAESVVDDMEPYLGLRYPASDIPQQARQLYLKQWLRQIVDVDAVPVSVHPAQHPLTGQPFDMSHCVLRAVSPIHLQYCRNMGVGASLAVSLVHEDKLWGMLVCHHRTPYLVPYRMRAACELLGATLSPQLVAKETAAFEKTETERYKLLGELLKDMAHNNDLVEACRLLLPQLQTLFDADGVSIAKKQTVHCHGATPEPGDVPNIIEQVHTQPANGLSHCFDWPERSGDPTARFAGVLVVALSDDVHLVAFRRPRTHHIRWGGDPNKAMHTVGGSDRLVPRASFREYVETIRGQSKPWSELDLDLAAEFRRSMLTFIVTRLENSARDAAIRKRLEANLEESEIKLALAFEAGGIGFWEFDPLNQTVHSTHWMRMLGYDDVPNVTLEHFNALCHPDDIERVKSALDNYIQGNAPHYCQQFRLKRREGRWSWVESRGRVIRRDEEGRPVHMVGVHLDIDALKLSQERLLSKNDELQSFIYAVSHDLKSPLVTCRGFLGMLKEDLHTGDTTSAQDDIERIDRSIANMGMVIDDLLELGRLGRDGLTVARCDLQELLEPMADSMRPLFDKAKAKLVLPESWPVAEVDRHALRRIMQNLLENALRHGCTQPGTTVSITWESTPTALQLSVKDDGPGIDPAYHEKIFALFERLHVQVPGTGVGLASVAKAAELHGGRAWVVSQTGQGATFHVTLPQHTQPSLPNPCPNEN